MKKILTLATIMTACNCFADYYCDDCGYDQSYYRPYRNNSENYQDPYYYQGHSDGYYQGHRDGYFKAQDRQSSYRNRDNRGFNKSNNYGDRSYDSSNTYDSSNRDNKYNDRFNSPEDQKIAKKIRDKVSGWFSSYGDVNVAVNNGNVTLKGTVKSESDKNELEKKVRNMDGVRSLNSQLVVTDRDAEDNDSGTETLKGDKIAREFPQDRAASPSDEQLNKKIREKISEGWFTNSYKNIQLDTQNGEVTINGSVEKPKEELKLTDEIRKIQGVRNVKTHIQIKNQDD